MFVREGGEQVLKASVSQPRMLPPWGTEYAKGDRAPAGAHRRLAPLGRG